MSEVEHGSRPIGAGKVLSIVVGILLLPVIVINLALIISTYTHPGQIPSVAGYKPMIVLSGSMEPVFNTGDMVIIRDTDTASLKEGDVICYLSSGSAVTHRIAGITESEGQTRYVTKGDANNAEDQLAVSPDQVQGIYTGIHIPKAGSAAMFLQSTTGMVVCIVCPLILFIGWDMLRRNRREKKERQEKEELEAQLRALKESKG